MKVSLRTAVLCSAAIHAGFLALHPGGWLSLWPGFRHPLESRDLSTVDLEGIDPPAPAPKPEPVPVRAVESSRPVEPAPARPRPVPRLEPAPHRAAAPPPVVSAAPPTLSADLFPQVSAETPVLPEKDFAAIRHKELVREHLRKGLRYPQPLVEGTVRLRVSLLPDGSLEEVAALDSSDPRLAALALRDARSSAPYPRFPKEMEDSLDTEYEFLVQYRSGDSSS